MTGEQIDERKAYIERARASFVDQNDEWTKSSQKNDRPALASPMLGISLLLGLFLFLLFVYCDVSGHEIGTFTTRQVADLIAEKDDYTNLEKYVMMLLADNN